MKNRVLMNFADRARSAVIILPFLAAPGLAAWAQGAPLPLLPVPPTAAAADTDPVRPLPDRIVVQDLSAPDPSAAGLLDEAHGGFSDSLWAGSVVGLVQKMLPLLPAPTPWPGLRALERKLLLTGAAVPAGKPSGESLISLRAKKLWALGEVETVLQLLKTVPGGSLTIDLRHLQIDAALLAGDTATACDQGNALRSLTGDDPFPTKLQAFCLFAGGKGREAGLSVDLLRDQKIADPAFFAAADSLSGSGSGRLDVFAAATPLTLAMARLAKLALPEQVAVSIQSPVLLRTLAGMPAVTLEARLLAAEKAEATGALEAEGLRKAYESLPLTPQELTAPVGSPPATPRGRALLFRLSEEQVQPATKAATIAKALSMAADPVAHATAARLYAPQLAALTPTGDLAWFAMAAAHALIAAHRPDAARAWMNLPPLSSILDASPGLAPMPAALVWPLARLAGLDVPKPLTAILADWRRARGDLPTADAVQRRTLLLYGVLAGLGDKIPEEDWLPLYDAPGALSAKAQRPALAIGLRLAGDNRRLGETVLLGLVALGELSQTDPDSLFRVVTALRSLGLDADARALALDAALANGI